MTKENLFKLMPSRSNLQLKDLTFITKILLVHVTYNQIGMRLVIVYSRTNQIQVTVEVLRD